MRISACSMRLSSMAPILMTDVGVIIPDIAGPVKRWDTGGVAGVEPYLKRAALADGPLGLAPPCKTGKRLRSGSK
jgi:hypothetical protein